MARASMATECLALLTAQEINNDYFMWDTIVYSIKKYPLDYIENALVLLPVVTGFFRWKYEEKAVRLAVIYFLLAFVKINLTIWYALNGWHNLHIYNGFILVDILLLGSVYVFAASFPTQRFWIGLLTGLAFLAVSISLWLDLKANEFSAFGHAIFRLTIIIIVLITFSWWMTQLRVRNLLLYPLFWLSAGLLLYATGTFFIYLFSQYALTAQEAERFDFYWKTNQILYILFCVFATIGFWVSKYNQNNLA